MSTEVPFTTDRRTGQLRAPRNTAPRAAGPWDVKREFKELYAPANRDWELVEVPAQRFLAVDGRGDPNLAPAYGAGTGGRWPRARRCWWRKCRA